MKKIATLLLWHPVFLLCIAYTVRSQVYTESYSFPHVTAKGLFGQLESQVEIILPAKNNDALRRQDEQRSKQGKPFRFAESIGLDISLTTNGQWESIDSGFLVWRIKLVSKNAYSTSINFDRFHLSNDAVLFIYNGDGTMITGPVTSKENNDNGFWGSSIYKGESVIVELKVPAASASFCDLHIKNLAHGFKSLFSSLGFNASAACNVDVLCTEGNGWEAERNSVALILDDLSSDLCSGALLGTTCNINIPYLLTANHCYTALNNNGTTTNVAQWKFIFKYWSPACQSGTDGTKTLLFNGSVKRANYALTDFTLLELMEIPQPSSGLTYAGWNRSPAPALWTTGIHHPRGDVMKISHDGNGPLSVPWSVGPDDHWRVAFGLGIVQPGSSGSPLFDQNHRIIGQLHGGSRDCQGANDNYACWCQFPFIAEYGRFDISWNGGGSSATRLSNWLDPSNTGTTTINTANVSASSTTPQVICLPNLSYCKGAAGNPINFTSNFSGATFTWTSSANVGFGTGGNASIPSFTASNPSNSTPLESTVTVTATANGITGSPTIFTVRVNPIPSISTGNYSYCNSESMQPGPSFITNVSGTTFSWTCMPNIGFGTSGTTVDNGQISPFIPVNNSTDTVRNSTIRVTGSANGCASVPLQGIATGVQIYSSPAVNLIQDYTYTHGTTGAAVNFSSPAIPTSAHGDFLWSGTANVGFGISGSGNSNPIIPSYTATNATSNIIRNTVTVSARRSSGLVGGVLNCISTPTQAKKFIVTVNPLACGTTATWTGAVNTNYNAVGNWSTNCIPNASMDVVIPSGTPTLTGVTVSVKSINIQSGVTLNLNNGAVLNVIADFVNNGTIVSGGSPATGKIIFGGTAVQNISGAGLFSHVEVTNTIGVILLSDVTVKSMNVSPGAKLTIPISKTLITVQ